MAQNDYGEVDRQRVGVSPLPALPEKAPIAGPLAQWLSKLSAQLRFAFSRYGMATNSLSLMEDQDKLRMRFIRRY